MDISGAASPAYLTLKGLAGGTPQTGSFQAALPNHQHMNPAPLKGAGYGYG